MKSANKTLLHFLFVLGTVTWTASPCFTQSPSPPPAAAPAQTVKLTMIATDSANHSVDEVRQEDVQLIENKLPQIISLFSRDVRPVDYALVVDNSGSFRDLIKPVIAAAKLIVNGNNPADETFIERFISSDKVETVVDFTPDKAKLIEVLDWFYAEKGQSAVVDGVYLAVNHTAEHRNGAADRRRAVVVFTDGEDRASYYGDGKLAKLLREKDVQVFVVGIVNLLSKQGGLVRRSPREAAEALLHKIAGESGGRVFFPRDNDELMRAAAEIVHDLHFQYLIGFEPPGKPVEKGFRTVTVGFVASPNREQLKLITRPGYLMNVQNAIPKAEERTSP